MIVIGGGLAGLVAARDLGTAGRHVLLLEARDRLGGRAWVRRFDGTSTELDFGGTWVLPGHHPSVMAELTRYGILTDPTPLPTRFVNVLGGERLDTSEIPAGELEDLHTLTRAGLAAVPAGSLGEALAAPAISPLGRAYATAYTRYLAGADPSEVAGRAVIDPDGWGFSDPDHYSDKIAGGTRRLVEALAAEAAVELRLGAVVTEVEDDGSGVVATLADGTRATAGAAIVALPVNVWKDVGFTPGLSAPKQALAEAGHAGHSVKVWALTGGVREFVRGLADDGPIAYLRTERLLPGDRALLVGFGADPTFDPTDPAAVERAIRRFLPEAELLACDGHDWNGDRFSRGTWFAARPGLPGPAELGELEGRLAFAGGDLSPTMPGTLDGAIGSGRAAAAAVAELLERGTVAHAAR